MPLKHGAESQVLEEGGRVLGAVSHMRSAGAVVRDANYWLCFVGPGLSFPF